MIKYFLAALIICAGTAQAEERFEVNHAENKVLVDQLICLHELQSGSENSDRKKCNIISHMADGYSGSIEDKLEIASIINTIQSKMIVQLYTINDQDQEDKVSMIRQFSRTAFRNLVVMNLLDRVFEQEDICVKVWATDDCLKDVNEYVDKAAAIIAKGRGIDYEKGWD